MATTLIKVVIAQTDTSSVTHKLCWSNTELFNQETKVLKRKFNESGSAVRW